MPSIKLIINGAAGRMGRRLLALATQNSAVELVGALDTITLQGRPISELDHEIKSSLILATDFSMAADVMIDFSTPIVTVQRVNEAVKNQCALVIGTTGLNAEQEKIVHAASKKIPLIHAANYSLGVNLLIKVAGEMAQRLGTDFNIEITEAHHNKKVDAPSGTALAIAKNICAATKRDYPADLIYSRNGKVGARPKKEIGMHALRMGSVIGDHTIFFGSDFERLEFTHRAQSRDVFAYGALQAALWLAKKPAGFYTMNDVLG